MRAANYKVRLSSLLRTLIEGGFLTFDGQNFKTTEMTKKMLQMYKESPTPLSQVSITFEADE